MAPEDLKSLSNVSFALEFDYPYAGMPISSNEFERAGAKLQKELYQKYVNNIKDFFFVQEF